MSRSLRMLLLPVLGISAALSATATLAGCPEDETPDGADASTPTPSSTATATTTATTPAPSASDAAAPDSAPPALAPTHTGLVSIQDITIANVPAAGHGLTATTILNRAVAPTYEEIPGSVEGCRVFAYDVDTKPQPAEEDHGVLRIDGAKGGNLECRFVPQRGYVCPTATGGGTTTVAASTGSATYTVPGAAFSANDVGRYLQITGTGTTPNLGAFAIVAAPSPTSVEVANPRAVAESFAGSFTVLAGAGPTPNDLYRPFEGVSAIDLDLPEKVTFASPKASVRPGDAFTLDEATAAAIVAVPLDGAAKTFRCASCGTADGTIVRIQTTDASVTGLSPVAFPAPKKKAVEIQCVRVGKGEVTVPAAAMEYLKTTHAASPITRIRTAYMRDGLRVNVAAPPLPPNRIALAVGRGTIGFTSP